MPARDGRPHGCHPFDQCQTQPRSTRNHFAEHQTEKHPGDHHARQRHGKQVGDHADGSHRPKHKRRDRCGRECSAEGGTQETRPRDQLGTESGTPHRGDREPGAH